MAKVEKTSEEWKAKLTDEQYHVTREKGTESPFTGKYWQSTAEGKYFCICCDEELFASEDKFDAGCGWPSFSLPINDDNICEHQDKTLGMTRVEVTCHNCDAHLGHVFTDGPAPKGLRYCINSASIDFKANDS